MFKTKYDFLIDTYEEMGVLRFMAKIPPTDTRYIMCQEMLKEVDRISEVRRASDV